MVVKRPHLKKSKQDIQSPSCSRHFASVRIGVSGDIGNIHQIRTSSDNVGHEHFPATGCVVYQPSKKKTLNKKIVNSLTQLPAISRPSPEAISHLTLLPNEFVNLILPLCMKMRRDANQRRGTWKTRHSINFGDDEIVFLLAMGWKSTSRRTYQEIRPKKKFRFA